MNKRIKTYFQTTILPYILFLYVKFVYFSSKKKFFIPSSINEDEIYIIAFWHGNLLMHPFTYKKIKLNGKVATLISEHRDGLTISNTVKLLGIDTIKGSSTRGGVKALISAIKAIKNGIDIAITPDGPKGPKYSIADGIIALSQKTKKKIITFHYEANKVWRLNSWDNFIIPKPFNEINFYVSEPLSIQDLDLNEAKKILKKYMREYD